MFGFPMFWDVEPGLPTNILPPGKYLSENMHDFCNASADNHQKSVLASIHRNSLEQFADF